MTELILNSNDHKIDSNKLRYEFKSPINETKVCNETKVYYSWLK